MAKTLVAFILIALLGANGQYQLYYPKLQNSPAGTIEANTREVSTKQKETTDNTETHTQTLSSSQAAASSFNQTIKEKIVGDKIVDADGKAYDLHVYKPLLAPNDPNYNAWWVQNIALEQAWDVAPGSHQTTLAIIDTGFALGHEEFENRWHQNNGEIGTTTRENPSDLNCSDQSLPLTADCNNIDDDGDGVNDNEANYSTTIENPSRLNCTDQLRPLNKNCNLIDDDSNGLIDDWRGWDFINHDQSVQAGEMNPDGTGTHHGSYVTGVAAATGNNSIGIAGVDWQTKILPIQALDDDSFGHTLSVARSIRYAYQQGADIISLSLGSSYNDSYLQSVIAEAINAGSIVVAASGNDGCDCILYPANFPEVVAVGASTSANTPASFSNYGSNLDVLAPGVSLYTTNWQKNNQTSAYATVSGTSLATPVVAGLLSLMHSHQPDASANQMIAALTEQVDRLSLASNQARTNTTGFGKIIASSSIGRVANSHTLNQRSAFVPVSYGGTHEARGNKAYAYDCISEGRNPTTPIFTMTKNNTRLFTMSHIERNHLIDSGYNSTLLAYTCLSLPDDTHTSLRSINLNSEFFQSNYKHRN